MVMGGTGLVGKPTEKLLWARGYSEFAWCPQGLLHYPVLALAGATRHRTGTLGYLFTVGGVYIRRCPEAWCNVDSFIIIILTEEVEIMVQYMVYHSRKGINLIETLVLCIKTCSLSLFVPRVPGDCWFLWRPMRDLLVSLILLSPVAPSSPQHSSETSAPSC